MTPHDVLELIRLSAKEAATGGTIVLESLNPESFFELTGSTSISRMCGRTIHRRSRGSSKRWVSSASRSSTCFRFSSPSRTARVLERTRSASRRGYRERHPRAPRLRRDRRQGALLLHPMRVVVASTYVPFIRGGGVNIVHDLVRELRRRSHDVDTVLLPFAMDPATIPAQMLALRPRPGVGRRPHDRDPNASYILAHPNKVVWLIHHHRGAYDLWGNGLPGPSSYEGGDRDTASYRRSRQHPPQRTPGAVYKLEAGLTTPSEIQRPGISRSLSTAGRRSGLPLGAER